MTKYWAMIYLISGINLTVWGTWIGVITGGVFIGAAVVYMVRAATEEMAVEMMDDYEVGYGTDP